MLDDQGRIHAGCNVENAAYPEGVCAEASALAAMVLAGSTRALAVLVVGNGGKNHSYGHQAGDDCPRMVADTLKANAQRAGDLVARYGGEEFVVITASLERDQALAYAQKLCRAMEAKAVPHEASAFRHVSISIGVATVTPMPGKSSSELLKKADEALYLAKSQGRNHAVLAPGDGDQ